VAPSYWSTSASGPHPGTSHLTGGPHHSATWQSSNGPPHPTLCYMAASQATTSSDTCYVAAYHEATSLFEIQQLDTWQHQSEPPQQLSATWHFLIGPPHRCGPHHTTWQAQTGAMSPHNVHTGYMWPYLVGTGQHR
jgi:hypothetical protein